MKKFASLLTLLVVSCVVVGCDAAPKKDNPGPEAVSGVKEVKPEVKTGPDGLTNEQRNIRDRYKMDSQPGAIKHLYVISAYSGDVLIYSTVKGKVTSSGKRLSPTSVSSGAVGIGGQYGGYDRLGIPVTIGGQKQYTSEVLQDDGTYGGSIDYLYWFDSDGRYHQHYPAGGTIVYVSNEPVKTRKPVISFEIHKE